MERTQVMVRHRRNSRCQPRRVVFLWILCLFAMASLLALLVISPAAGMLLSQGEEDSPADSPQGGTYGALDVPFLDQREKYPTGCESVTAVMALQYIGVDVTVEEFIDDYLPQGAAPYEDDEGELVGDSPWQVFLGSPYEESGWGCYAPVIVQAVEKLLADRGSSRTVKDLTGISLDRLCQDYVFQGTPVMVWATIDMEEPVPSTQYLLQDTGERFTWMYPLHCLLLTGETQDCYLFNDPLVGKDVAYSKEQVERAYQGIGMQAVVVQ